MREEEEKESNVSESQEAPEGEAIETENYGNQGNFKVEYEGKKNKTMSRN